VDGELDPQFVTAYRAGESVPVDVAFPSSVAGYTLRAAVARTFPATRPSQTPLAVYTGPPELLAAGDGLTVSLTIPASATDAVGPGMAHLGLWRVDAGEETCLCWVIFYF
jgi:hypothetical protein